MQEKLLHFIWQNLLLNSQDLYTSDKQPLRIIQRGTLNTHSGPDFTNCKVVIDGTLWAGDIEIHHNSSEWNAHKHFDDKAYDSTILHVCWNDDARCFRSDASAIPCLTLRSRVNASMLETYSQLINSTKPIPCQAMLGDIDEFTWIFWQERLIIERLEYKVLGIMKALETQTYNWQEVFYQSLAEAFGLKINKQPFGILAHNLSLKILSKHKNSLVQIEALLLGSSGFLNGIFQDEYAVQLQKEYNFLKSKYGLFELDKSHWKFLRLMPANFPTIRLVQFAMLIHTSSHLFSKIIEEKNGTKISDLLMVSPSTYWETHYVLDKKSAKRTKTLGQSAIQNIIINAIVPFKFAYGKYKDQEDLVQNALDLLGLTKPEKNSIIRTWESLGVSSKNALQSQALLQLKNEYCVVKKCLNCAIGQKVLKK